MGTAAATSPPKPFDASIEANVSRQLLVAAATSATIASDFP